MSAVLPALADDSGPSGGAAGHRGFAGLTLAEALRELNARGLSIVFTSELVRPEMRVEEEPATSAPRQVLDELLAPHGLEAAEGPGGTLVVVQARGPRPAIAGRVRTRGAGEPLAGARVRVLGTGIEAVSDDAGRFVVRDLVPGTYALEAERADYLPVVVAGVAVTADGPARVDLVLQPAPFISEEIVVRPSEVVLLQEEPLAPLALSRDEIQSLPHLAGDPFRALDLLPGTASNDVTAQFHVHGGRRDEVQVLLDGQELYDAYHLQDYDRALSVVAPGGLASVSLSTGAFPASYGDRMSGVLDMTTREPTGSVRTLLSLSVLSAVAASGGAFADDEGWWHASGRRGSIDLANRVLGKEDPAFWDVFAKVAYPVGTGDSLRAHLLHASDALDFRETVDGQEKAFDTDYDSSYLWLRYVATLGERVLVETSSSWSRLDRDRRGAETDEEQFFDILDRRTAEVTGLGQDWSLQASSRHTVRWGFEARSYDAEYDYFNLLEPDLVVTTPPAVPRGGITRFVGELKGEHLGLYALDRFSPLEPLTVELGLRYDRHTLTDDTLVSPRANVAWRLGKATVLRASWGLFHQSQRPYELQVEDGETELFPAERSEHWVLGYERLFGRRQQAPLSVLRIEAYRRQIDHPRVRYENIFEPINTFPEAEPDRVRLAPDASRAEGIELVLRGALGPRAEWWLNYAYATADDRFDAREIPRQIDQTHTLNLLLSTRLPRSWSLSVAWRYHTGWPTTPVFLEEGVDEEGEAELTLVLGRLNSDRLPAYHRMDLRASREWERPSGRLTFFVDLQNVYDRSNLAGFDLDIDDEAGVLLKMREDWPGIYPSVGVSWEF